MKKSGFTMVELLAVIAILGLLAAIIYPIVNRSLSKSKQELYDVQIRSIETSAKNWGADHMALLPKQNGQKKTITLAELKDGGYIDSKLENPKTKKPFADSTTITITMVGNSLEYEVK